MFFLFISFIIPLCLFNIICRVALLGFCFSGKITRFSQQVVSRAKGSPLGCLKLFVILNIIFWVWNDKSRRRSEGCILSVGLLVIMVEVLGVHFEIGGGNIWWHGTFWHVTRRGLGLSFSVGSWYCYWRRETRRGRGERLSKTTEEREGSTRCKCCIMQKWCGIRYLFNCLAFNIIVSRWVDIGFRLYLSYVSHSGMVLWISRTWWRGCLHG